MSKTIVLASTSIFRKQLLEKLQIDFSTASPVIDETHRTGEAPQDLVQRLSSDKAAAIAEQPEFSDALIIGSDQVACIDGDILGKPGNFENALKQLTAASGKIVAFYTGLCLLNAETGHSQVICEEFKVHFRSLSGDQITRYLKAEEPYNCAGSFKSESFGISLFSKLEGDDPNSLIGLPLIRLIKMFEQEGVNIP